MCVYVPVCEVTQGSFCRSEKVLFMRKPLRAMGGLGGLVCGWDFAENERISVVGMEKSNITHSPI